MDYDFSNESEAVKIIALILNVAFLVSFYYLEYLAFKRLIWTMQRSAVVLLITYSFCKLHRVVFDSIRLGIDTKSTISVST
jgi:hypothetical protein